MSWRAVQYARGRAPTASSQLVLSGYCDHADDCGVTFVGQETVAKDCSCGERTVRRGLALLEAVGVVVRVRRHDGRGHRTSDWVVVAPFADDRRPMLEVAVKHPELVLKLESLAARLAGRPGIPTGQIDHPYRPNRPSLPANLAGEKLEEQLEEPPPAAARDIARDQPEPAEAPVVGEQQNKNQGNSNVNVTDATDAAQPPSSAKTYDEHLLDLRDAIGGAKVDLRDRGRHGPHRLDPGAAFKPPPKDDEP